ncbi:DUF2061 domain-containing protein [Aliiglaciecola sp. 3_MG-2023]|uniref:DUF2061 domain-containing protein n=1 Tax=Aliiglaciecola sp. 3_MG-2023 TaxID=3062644 RepID=UPI0026E164A5|nr:DUF2061 domain-containing protein [Aliiglaciecola sp. 3_MG-2023]MDO6693395.1 DUF2061 domain-containing protein [Aliiglaciecola sp. 3_MG-2023]
MKKTITFACLHFTVAFTVAYLLTGSAVIGGAVALVEPAVNTVVFYFHERVWKKFESQSANKINDSSEQAFSSNDMTFVS